MMLIDMHPQLQFAVDIGHLHNVDLFSRGYYQIRTGLKCSSKVSTAKIDVHLLRSSASQLFPASVIDGQAVSTTAEVMYAHETIRLGDQINFIVTLNTRVDKLPRWIDFTLNLELWFVEKDRFTRLSQDEDNTEWLGNANIFAGFRCVSRRNVSMCIGLSRGVHYHRPILFDFYHLAAVSITIHASLVGLLQKSNRRLSDLSQPSLTRSRNQLWGSGNALTAVQNGVNAGGSVEPKVSAYHRSICAVLLQAYENLQRRIRSWSDLLPVPISIQMVDTEMKLDALCRRLTDQTGDGDGVWQLIEQDRSLLSQELVVLWSQFIELFRGLPVIETLLAREHHAQRVKRFGEAFFHSEETMQCLLARSYTGSWLARLYAGLGLRNSSVGLLAECIQSFSQSARIVDLLRRSQYYQSIAPLSVACDDIDGTSDSFPIIFEEKYWSSALRSMRSVSSDKDSEKGALSRTNSTNDRKMKRLKKTLCLDLATTTHPTTSPTSSTGPNSFTTTTDSACGSLVTTIQPKPPSIPPPSVEEAESESCVTTTSVDVSDSTGTSDREDELNQDYGVYDVYSSISESKPSQSPPNRPLFVRSNTQPNLANPNDSNDEMVASCANFVEAVLNRSSSETDINGVHMLLSEAVVPPSKASVQATGSNTSVNGKSLTDRPLWKKILIPKVPIRKKRRAKLEKLNGTTASVSGSNENEPDATVMPSDVTITMTNDVESDDGYDQAVVASTSSGSSITTRTSTHHHPLSHVDSFIVDFVRHKESFKEKMSNIGFVGHLYSDVQSLSSNRTPYLLHRCKYPTTANDQHSRTPSPDPSNTHLIVCVHGLDGSRDDLRPYQTFMRLCYAADGVNVDFLMSESNQEQTFAGFETLSTNLVNELLCHLAKSPIPPSRISFISHSMGALVVRAACGSERLSHVRHSFYTYLSLNAPHCGLLFNQKTASLGLSVMQWWKKSLSLEQLSIRDQPIDSLRQSFLYELSKNNCFAHFRHVLVVGSAQDLYVPCHSALIQPCKAAQKDNTQYGVIYGEMVNNMLSSIASSARHTTFVRYIAFHGFAGVSRTHQVLGRAAHVAVLDDDLFVEKLLSVSVMQYLQ